MELTQYHYEELSRGSRFRLFRFEKSQPCSALRLDELRIHLFDVDFADPPAFEAVSYAWGQNVASSAIVCNGQRLLVTPNVEAILRVLATRSESVGTFWIDSICIDQRNVSEKNVQVPRMRSIYSEARVVWIWLGADSFETRTAFRFLVDAADMIERFMKSASDINSQAVQPPESSYDLRSLFQSFRDRVIETRDYYDSVDTNFIVDLLNLAWFHRTWTIQELVLAQNAVLMCDHLVLPWSSFIRTLETLQTQDVMDSRLYPTSNPPSFYNDTVCYRILANLSRRSQSQRLQSRPQISIVLELARSKSAAKPEDKVYGLYGILDHGRMDVVPKVDYNHPVHSIYTAITTAAIQHEMSLSILYQACLPALIPNLPSWVPDFSNSGYFSPARVSRMHASNFAKHFYSFNGLELSVSGILIDKLSEVAESTSIALASFRRGYKARMDIGETVQRRTGVVKLIRTMQAWIKLSRKLHSYPTDEDPSEVFYRVIGQDDVHVPDSLDRSVLHASLKKWSDTLTSTFTDDPSFLQSLLDQVQSLPGYNAMLNDYATLFDQGTSIETWPDELKIRLILRLASPEVAYIQHDIFLNTYHRTFVLTCDGYMGICPRWARAGDLVALIAGLNTPFIVREAGEHYNLIGPAYIEGVMCGERWDDGEAKTITLV